MISIRHVTRRYSDAVIALDDVSLDIAAGEFVAITGPSGCGKSTLLHLIGGLDTPTFGEVVVGGLSLHGADDARLTAYRRTRVGIVFQFFHLLPTLTVTENVCLPLLLRGDSHAAARAKADEIIGLVGLSDRAQHGMHQLSGGQLQRTAIARALVHEPAVLLADEPTGNLDSASARQVMELLQKISSQRRTTMVVVTHSDEIVASSRQVDPSSRRENSNPAMSNTSDLRSKLKDHALFAEFNPQELGELLDLLDKVNVTDGNVIVKQDEPGDCMYLVVEGDVRVVHHRGGRDITLATLKPGDFFGEIALVDNGPRSADVVAQGSGMLLKISHASVAALAGVYPTAAFKFLIAIGRIMVSRLRTSNQRYVDSLLFPVEGKD